MALTISEELCRAIRAAVEARRLAAKLAEAEAIDWDVLPRFTSVDDFLAHLDILLEPETSPTAPHKPGVEI